MSENIWTDGKEIDKDRYIKACQAAIEENQAEIDVLKLVEQFIDEAIAERFKRKYATLNKALKEYGDLNGVHDAYGYDYISYEQFCKIQEQDAEYTKIYNALQDLDITKPIHRAIQSKLEAIGRYNNRIEGAIGYGERDT